jgi:large subunit ribosomal protein L30
MVEKKAPAAEVAPKAPVAKAAKPAAAQAAAPVAAAGTAKKTIVVQQYASAARRPAVQTATLKGLGLNKIRRTRELEDTPSIRGMVHAVRHMVKIIEERG